MRAGPGGYMEKLETITGTQASAGWTSSHLRLCVWMCVWMCVWKHTGMLLFVLKVQTLLRSIQSNPSQVMDVLKQVNSICCVCCVAELCDVNGGFGACTLVVLETHPLSLQISGQPGHDTRAYQRLRATASTFRVSCVLASALGTQMAIYKSEKYGWPDEFTAYACAHWYFRKSWMIVGQCHTDGMWHMLPGDVTYVAGGCDIRCRWVVVHTETIWPV